MTLIKISFNKRISKLTTSKQGLVMPIVLVFMLLSQLVYWGLLHLNQTNSQRYINFNGYYESQIQQMMTQSLLTQPLEEYLAAIEHHVMTNMLSSFDVMQKTLTLEQWWLSTPQVGIGTLNSSDFIERIFVYEHQLFLDETQINYCSLFSSLFCEGKLNANNTYDPLYFDPSTHYFKDETITSKTFDELTESLIEEGFTRVKLNERNAQYIWQDQTIPLACFFFANGTVSLQKQKTHYYLNSQLNHPAMELSSQHPYKTLRYLIKLKGYFYERDLTHD